MGGPESVTLAIAAAEAQLSSVANEPPDPAGGGQLTRAPCAHCGAAIDRSRFHACPALQVQRSNRPVVQDLNMEVLQDALDRLLALHLPIDIRIVWNPLMMTHQVTMEFCLPQELMAEVCRGSVPLALGLYAELKRHLLGAFDRIHGSPTDEGRREPWATANANPPLAAARMEEIWTVLDGFRGSSKQELADRLLARFHIYRRDGDSA